MFFALLDYVGSLFEQKSFSEKGRNDREKEEATYMFFLDFLEECQSM